MHSDEEERHRMVKEQLEARGIKDEALLEVMRIIPRHLFVPVEFHRDAYADRACLRMPARPYRSPT